MSKENIFSITRDHQSGPGCWCIYSKRMPDLKPIIVDNGRVFTSIIARILNNPDKYPEFDDFLCGIREVEEFNYKHKDDVPPRKIQEELENVIKQVIEGSK